MAIWKTVLLTCLALAILGVLAILFLVHQGFRATSSPSALETAVALTLRNLAIPLHNRHEKNPFVSSPETLQDARELYVNKCAVCHGIDGGGKTQIGLNLYPRVPDLRRAATQNLTDGEIHYIIENGVQLTGMPAWKDPHRQPNGDSWKLVLFILYLRPLTREQQAEQATTISTAHYVGSQSCERCHAQIYGRWKTTPMANVVRDPHVHPDAVLADFSHAPQFVNFTKAQIAFVYGSIWKQNYFTKVGNEYYPLPAKWDIAHHKWMPYLVKEDWWAPFYPPHNADHPTGPTCNGCHSVNYNIADHSVTEWNVGCEQCHGPGSQHVAHPTRGNILNPASMDPVAANNTCIQCHSQGRPFPSQIVQGKAYDWPVGYKVGLKLQNFWRLEDRHLGELNFYYFPEGTAHKNRMQGNDFTQSVMYQHRITCSTCHDVHGTSNYAELRKPSQSDLPGLPRPHVAEWAALSNA